MSMRNRDLIRENFEEAIEQLQEIVKELRERAEYSEPELRIDLEHAYHHINYAWHIRNATESELTECSGENFSKWSKFPIGEISEYEE